MSINHQRKSSDFFKAVSQIVSEEITNSNISWPTVTTVELSRDMSHLKVFVVFKSNKKRSLETLQKSKGFVKSKLARMVSSRIVPDVHFKLDNSQEIGNNIERILQEIKNKKQPE